MSGYELMYRLSIGALVILVLSYGVLRIWIEYKKWKLRKDMRGGE